MEYSVEMKSISKEFPKVLANDCVDFQVKRGEIHALVGENGAGKSTLMNQLYGIHRPTSGHILINGKEVEMHSTLDAIKNGIGMVHQHFMLIPRLTVADNIVLGIEPRKSIFYDRHKACKKVESLCSEYGLIVDPSAVVENISLGMQQRVEICKALYRGAEIIILDEPTAVLTPQEVDDLIEVMKELKKMGKTLIIITHKLDEVMAVSDRITVLRMGKKIGTVNTHETTLPEVTQMMVGRHVELGGNKKPTNFKEHILELKNVSLNNNEKVILEDISLHIKRGEILGVAGIDESGQTPLTEVIAGVLKPDSGQVFYKGENISRDSVISRKKNGIGFIPQNRHKHGLVLEHSLEENLILGFQWDPYFHTKKWFINSRNLKKNAISKIKKYDIRAANELVTASTLSGGNQQKVIIARETDFDPDLLIANQPTRGVDIGAIEFIHNLLVDLRNAGKGIILVSLELDEVMMLSDRIAVMYNGRLMGIVDADKITREEIGLMMVGNKDVSKEKEVK